MGRQQQRNLHSDSFCRLASSILMALIGGAVLTPGKVAAWSPSITGRKQAATTTGLNYDSTIWYRQPTTEEGGWQPTEQLRTLEAQPSNAIKNNTFHEILRWQTDFLRHNIPNLQPLPVRSRSGRDMSVCRTDDGGSSITTQCWSSDEYRLIRMTDYDAGSKGHVLSSMLYPRSSLLPVLGMELIRMGPKLHILAADWQPVRADEMTSTEYTHTLEDIRASYPSLQGTLRDSNMGVLFSDHLLLGQTTNTEDVETMQQEFFAAMQRYHELHVEWVQAQQGTADVATVQHHHARLDALATSVDKSKRILSQTFGEAWAQEYIQDVMFPLANGVDDV